MDSVEVKLPVSGKTVVIRNYTTRGDDDASNSVLYAGVVAKGTVDSEFQLPLANAMASREVYVTRLVQSIDGNSAEIAKQLSELRTADYSFLSDRVSEIVEENSPKVLEDKNSSPTDTTAK